MYEITKSDIDELLSAEVQELFQKNENLPFEKLILKLNKSSHPVNLIADQIKCRKKALKKFPTFSQKNIVYESTAFEQSSSEATAIYKASFINGEKLIDLTGGLGIDVIRLSKNFNHTIYSEMNPNLVELFRYNSSLFDTGCFEINYGDSIEYLKKYTGKKFDWIYLDPARREGGRRSVDLEYCSPNVYENLNLLNEKSHNLCIKVSPAFDFKEAELKVPGLTDYIVVSVNNECKEVLLILKNCEKKLTKHAVLLDEFGNVSAQYSAPANRPFRRDVSEKPGKYFYEPDVAVIKSELSDFIAEKYNLYGINNSAHFFTSDDFISDFPGRTFQIKDVLAYNPGQLKKYFRVKGINRANISKREFPRSVAEIRKELKLAEGGNTYLFLTKSKEGKLILLETDIV